MKAADIRSKSVTDLEKQLAKLREKQAKLRLEIVTKSTRKPSDFRTVRKDIAVLETVIKEKQLAEKPGKGAKDA